MSLRRLQHFYRIPYYKKLALEIGKVLGHVRGEDAKPNANTATKSYIDPELGRKFFKKLGLHEPKFLE